MLLWEPKSCADGYEIGSPKADYESAKKAGQYRVSSQAFYFPAFPGTKYVPFAAVKRAVLRNSGLPVSGCCGREIPVVKLFLEYEGGKQDFVIDPAGQGAVVAEVLKQAVSSAIYEDKR